LIWIKKALQVWKCCGVTRQGFSNTSYLTSRTLTIKYPALLEIVPIIARRVIIIGGKRKILAGSSPESILNNRDRWLRPT
jgi:hypothetical protein